MKQFVRRLQQLLRLPDLALQTDLNVSEAWRAIREVRALLEAQLLPKTRHGQLLLLWNTPRRPTLPNDVGQVSDNKGAPDDRPCCAALSLEMETGKATFAAFDRLHMSVPAGAWLVGIGCTFDNVIAGNELQSLGSGGKHSVLRIRVQIQLGVILRAEVRPAP